MPYLRKLAASHSRHWISYAMTAARIIALPLEELISPTLSTAARLSLGCAGSSDRYVSLKSRYRIRRPLTKVAHSAFDLPPPRSVAGGLPLLRSAQLRATANASAGIAPTAVANESMNRRLASWTTAAGSDSYFRLTEYAAK